ncbi:hypothetical protein B0A49_00409 [Cryomyces minteri]|uniref:Uncharacterized protein n=1 Tax=Cryomyces minteri TaxID=331657 RepID=A0A4U0XWI8_9PEZI|nr:hypothetical protein B0A49_00409 [Cryomyces minteri]
MSLSLPPNAILALALVATGILIFSLSTLWCLCGFSISCSADARHRGRRIADSRNEHPSWSGDTRARREDGGFEESSSSENDVELGMPQPNRREEMQAFLAVHSASKGKSATEESQTLSPPTNQPAKSPQQNSRSHSARADDAELFLDDGVVGRLPTTKSDKLLFSTDAQPLRPAKAAGHPLRNFSRPVYTDTGEVAAWVPEREAKAGR